MPNDNVVERNWRGQYPPVAILENTRRALSASAHSAKRDTSDDTLLLIDLAGAYQEVLVLENYIRKLRGIDTVKTMPMWVNEVARILEERTINER